MTEQNAPNGGSVAGPNVAAVQNLANMMAVMDSPIGSMAAQGLTDKPFGLKDLPDWLAEKAEIARRIIESFPQEQKPAEKVADPASEDQWKLVVSKVNGKILGILPENDLAERFFAIETEQDIQPPVSSKKALSSYDTAVQQCRDRVRQIIRDCKRKNQKFRDEEFQLGDHSYCLRSLVDDPDGDPYDPPPQAVAQARNIFEKPRLFVNGAKADDVKQGRGGDCWFLAGIAALTNLREGLNHNYVQVDGDEKVGVYGFVFHRGQ